VRLLKSRLFEETKVNVELNVNYFTASIPGISSVGLVFRSFAPFHITVSASAAKKSDLWRGPHS
jgi:hypothetical protein